MQSPSWGYMSHVLCYKCRWVYDLICHSTWVTPYTHSSVSLLHQKKVWFVQGLLELSEVLAAGGGETHLVTARPPTCITCLKIVVTVGGRLRVGQQFGGTDGRVLVFHLLPYTFPNRPTRDFVSRLRELEEVGAPIHSRPICYNYLGAPQWSCQKNHG